MNDLSRLQKLARAVKKLRIIDTRERLLGSLHEFIRYFWDVLEPSTPFVDGWPLEAICEHLEAVTDGKIKRILINVPPGSTKSLCTNVFWPAWVWARGGDYAAKKWLSFSYSSDLTIRDNGGIGGRLSTLVLSEKYRELFGHAFKITENNKTKFVNDKTGWKLASSIGGVGTGERGDVVILDDPHAVNQAESDVIRTSTVEWFANTMSNRLNSMDESAIVVIMQRVHENDVSGYIIEKELGYVHLMIPAISDGRRCETEIGWIDPREQEGINYWPQRISDEALDRQKAQMLDFAWAGQYQQVPEVRGGGLFKRDWWRPWNISEASRWGCRYPQYPAFDLIVAGLDTAYTTKQENDPSAMTVWGVLASSGRPTCIVLLAAWQAHIEFHDLLLRVAETCSRWRVDKLLVEAKASGISILQELRRTYGSSAWSMSKPPYDVSREDWERRQPRGQWTATEWSTIEVNPGSLDKVARATGVVGMLYDGLVYAPQVPDREDPDYWNWTSWAQMVIDQAAIFPRGTHDDLVDTMSMVLKWLRENGIATLAGEASYMAEQAITWRGGPPPPIYPGARG